jgi:hypothetical protein
MVSAMMAGPAIGKARHGRDQFFIALRYRKCLRVTNGDGSSWLEDARPKQKIIAARRGDVARQRPQLSLSPDLFQVR